jgi:hypothetical protein
LLDTITVPRLEMSADIDTRREAGEAAIIELDCLLTGNVAYIRLLSRRLCFLFRRRLNFVALGVVFQQCFLQGSISFVPAFVNV